MYGVVFQSFVFTAMVVVMMVMMFMVTMWTVPDIVAILVQFLLLKALSFNSLTKGRHSGRLETNC